MDSGILPRLRSTSQDQQRLSGEIPSLDHLHIEARVAAPERADHEAVAVGQVQLLNLTDAALNNRTIAYLHARTAHVQWRL